MSRQFECFAELDSLFACFSRRNIWARVESLAALKFVSQCSLFFFRSALWHTVLSHGLTPGANCVGTQWHRCTVYLFSYLNDLT